MLKSDHEVVESMKLLLDLVYKLGKVFPLHGSTLVMEVEPNVFDQVVFYFSDDVGKLRAYSKLGPLFINKINEYLFTIGLFHLLDMFLSECHRFIEVGMNLNGRTPLHCWFLTPKSRNGSSGLKVSSDLH